MTEVLGSVVVAAYDEQALIGRTLDHLLRGFADGELEVVVVPNGCTDDTAAVARRFPVRVVELAEASKAAALRAGDRSAATFPRIYLDADVLLPADSARAVLQHLRQPGALAARPPFSYDTGGCSSLVRRYYRARSALPSMSGSLWGAGVYALSEQGRARFGTFPDVTADDLFVDRHFSRDEVTIVDAAPVTVLTARTPEDLLQVLRRQNRGKQSLRAGPQPQPGSTVYRDLLTLAAEGPRSASDALVFACWAAASRSRPLRRSVRWERDVSSRLGAVAADASTPRAQATTGPGAGGAGAVRSTRATEP